MRLILTVRVETSGFVVSKFFRIFRIFGIFVGGTEGEILVLGATGGVPFFFEVEVVGGGFSVLGGVYVVGVVSGSAVEDGGFAFEVVLFCVKVGVVWVEVDTILFLHYFIDNFC